MTREILIKFLNNNCTQDELAEIVQWVKTKADSSEGKQLAFDDWKSFQVDEAAKNDEKYNILLDKIHHKINLNKRFYSEEAQKKSSFFKITNYLAKAAAILFLPMLGLLYYSLSGNPITLGSYVQDNSDSVEIIAPIGSRTVLQLSDGTKVYLNYGSRIKYPQKFTGKTRDVALIGEAYFEVAHNPKKSFVVKTKTLNVKALGTVFNVWAYTDTDNVQTTLVEGKVVLEQNKKGRIKRIGALVPGQHVVFNNDKGIVLSEKVNIEKYIAWKDGKLVFDNTSIGDVAKKLGRMFNVDIKVANDVKYLTYTVVFVDEPLFQILDLMAIATPIKYKTLKREKLPDGTFSKQRIIIEKK